MTVSAFVNNTAIGTASATVTATESGNYKDSITGGFDLSVQEQDFSQIVNIKDEEIVYRLGSLVCRDYVFQKDAYEDQIDRAAKNIRNTDCVIIGAGAGASTAAGIQ